MNPSEKAVVERFKALLLERTQLHKMILFGSRARGDADPHSDMDILVILNGPPSAEARNCVSECAWEAGFEHGIVVVPVVFTRDEWEHGPERYSLLAQAAETESVLL